MCIVDEEVSPVMCALQREQRMIQCTSDQGVDSESTNSTSKVNLKLECDRGCYIIYSVLCFTYNDIIMS